MQTQWTENDLVLDGVNLHYTRTGKGKKPPLVLAHGFSDSGLCWLPVALQLEDRYDLVLLDARGHGRSQRVQPGEDVDMPADLANLIRALQLEKPVVGGHSMGAHVSAQMAARNPGLARALVLEDPAWFPDGQPPRRRTEQEDTPPAHPFAWLLELEGNPVEKVMEKCRKDNPTWAEIELRPWAESKLQFDLNFLQIQRILQRSWKEVVPEIDCPTLVITADPKKGALVTPEMAKMIVEMNPRFRVVKIKGAGHSIRRENFKDYMQAVEDFLNEVSA
jgi:N-formylmaleamate deformylase